MALLDVARPAQTGHGFGGLSKLMGTISAWNDARLTRKALSNLTDRELSDIGLDRSEIESIR